MSNTVTLYFKAADDSVLLVVAKVGSSVMEAAVMGNVPSIEAECGGCCSCATCHVFAPADLRIVADDEDAMLDDTVTPRTSASRLSCQIVVESRMEGAIFAIPSTQ